VITPLQRRTKPPLQNDTTQKTQREAQIQIGCFQITVRIHLKNDTKRA